MTGEQKIIKYVALGLAALLIIGMVCSAISIISWLVNDDQVAEEAWTVDITGTFSSLDLELSATSLTVKSGDTFRIETNNKRLDFEVEDGILSVEERELRVFGEKYEAVLILTVPSSFVFTEVEISAGAGRIEMEALSAERVNFELGAGEVRINSLNTTGSTDIEGGAGRLEIGGGSISGLDLDMGVGELVLTAALVGNSSVDCGVGSSDITLLGVKDAYTVSVSKGMGSVTVDGAHLENNSTVGQGINRLSVSGGIGEIRLTLPTE